MVISFFKKLGTLFVGTFFGGVAGCFINFVFHFLWYVGHWAELNEHLIMWNRPMIVIGAIVGTVVSSGLLASKVTEDKVG